MKRTNIYVERAQIEEIIEKPTNRLTMAPIVQLPQCVLMEENLDVKDR